MLVAFKSCDLRDWDSVRCLGNMKVSVWECLITVSRLSPCEQTEVSKKNGTAELSTLLSRSARVLQMGWVFDICFKLHRISIYTRSYALSLYSFCPRTSTFSMVGREVHIDILKDISVNMYGPRVDIHHGMFDVLHDSICLYKLNASKATFGALPYTQLLVSWWTGVPGLPPARHLGSAKSGGSRKSVGCVAIKTHGRSVFE